MSMKINAPARFSGTFEAQLIHTYIYGYDKPKYPGGFWKTLFSPKVPFDAEKELDAFHAQMKDRAHKELPPGINLKVFDRYTSSRDYWGDIYSLNATGGPFTDAQYCLDDIPKGGNGALHFSSYCTWVNALFDVAKRSANLNIPDNQTKVPYAQRRQEYDDAWQYYYKIIKRN